MSGDEISNKTKKTAAVNARRSLSMRSSERKDHSSEDVVVKSRIYCVVT